MELISLARGRALRARADAKNIRDSFVGKERSSSFSPPPALPFSNAKTLSSSHFIIQMNVERLQKMAGTVRTGGKGTMRR
jgi:hypothetical protein